MSKTIIKRYSTGQIVKIDEECRKLVGLYSSARIKIGLELAKRLKEIEDNKLYLRLDEQSYPNFFEYLKSLDIKYKTAREIIGVYECYVLVAGKSINELASIAYHKLTTLKPMFFSKEAGKYKMIKPVSEMNNWLRDAKSNLTSDDLIQKRKEYEVGEHEHKFIKFHICTICGLKEIIN